MESLEFAHVRPNGVYGRGRGSRVRIVDVIENPDNYRLLCRDCHLDYDDKGVSHVREGGPF